MVEMELVGVRVEIPANTPVVLLRETEGQRRILPIYIGGVEATAIAFALESVVTPRPMTHDLIKDLLDDLGGVVERIVVTELREHTFYADLEVRLGDRLHKVSSRPSDAIAIAVRTGSGIFASEAVLDEAGQLAPETDEDSEEQEELVDEFREFINRVSPEDFAS